MLEANRLTLDDLAERVKGELVDSRVDGGVAIDSGTRLERATVRGPAVIGAGSVVCDAYVGQFTGIGERVCIERCEIEHSIVLADSTSTGSMGRSRRACSGAMSASDAVRRLPRAFRLVVGDNAETAIL